MTPRSAADADTLELVPPSRSTQVWLFVLAVALPLLITGIALQMVLLRAPAGTPNLTLPVIGAAVLISLVVWVLATRWLGRRHVSLGRETIEIASSLHTRRLALSELDLRQARVVDLAERSELRPRLKLLGMGLPGFRSGWFLLGNGRRGFVATAGGTRVLWIPTHKGHDLLLELQQPQAALEELRKRGTGEGSS